MAKYLAIQIREVLIDAASASEARTIAENVFFARPGHDAKLRKEMRVTNLNIEKVRN